ncbi:acyltransferase family protein [Leifsonia sp. F6_8S_P_1B]|uniref:Acyltransferase family protein n=1 Tax=Leifsonia williamsii TaxID=3035919 RepID=A0ABT8KFG7_9MICO|nr:acyltransferase family protein [Leifsonia williamsii]MDN4616193.1 acyltransferase family protein [Leifsonia williamsii]
MSRITDTQPPASAAPTGPPEAVSWTLQPAVDVRPGTFAPAPSRPSRRFSGLDGLRAFAVTVVLVYHLFPGVQPGGFIGVDVFFVISGFLITSLLMRERRSTGRLDLRRFWVRRARRLLPAIVALVVVCSTAALAIGGDVLVGLPRQVLGAATFSANWLSIAGDASYFAQGAPELFRNLWSLAVEEQFYLIWPVVVLALALLRAWWARVAIVATVAVASAAAMALEYLPGTDPTRVYFGSDSHSFGLALGAVVALLAARMRPVDLDAGESGLQLFVRRWLPALGVLSVLGLVVAAYGLRDDAAFTYRGGLVLVSLLTALAIWAAVVPGAALGRILDAPALRYVGVRSYGLYLWHWPVFVLACALVPDEHDPVLAVVVGVASLAVSAAAALLSFRHLEQPIREHGLVGAVRRLRDRVALSSSAKAGGYGLAALAVVLVAGTVAAIAVAPTTTGAERFITQGAASLHSGGPSAPSQRPQRIPPDPQPVAKGPDISAIGDSVMLASAPALQEAYPGIAVDAVVSRQLSAAPDLLQRAADAGALRKIVVLGLGTNGSISATSLDAVLDAIGPQRRLILVNVQAPRSWTDGVNQTLTAFAAQHTGRVVLADWKGAISGHLDLLADDQIHPGMRGGRVYADALHTALVELSQYTRTRPAQPWDRPRPQ